MAYIEPKYGKNNMPGQYSRIQSAGERLCGGYDDNPSTTATDVPYGATHVDTSGHYWKWNSGGSYYWHFGAWKMNPRGLSGRDVQGWKSL